MVVHRVDVEVRFEPTRPWHFTVPIVSLLSLELGHIAIRLLKPHVTTLVRAAPSSYRCTMASADGRRRRANPLGIAGLPAAR